MAETTETTKNEALEEACAFLKAAGTYYLATCEGGKPRVRPFGTAHIYEGKLYIQTGRKKAIYRQIKENPSVEVCACKDPTSWIRIEGDLVEDPRIEAETSMLDAYPELQGMYQPGDGNTCVLYFANAKATFASFTEGMRTVKL